MPGRETLLKNTTLTKFRLSQKKSIANFHFPVFSLLKLSLVNFIYLDKKLIHRVGSIE